MKKYNRFITAKLFFIDTDEQLKKIYSKLEQKKENYQEIYTMLQEKVGKHKENSDKYKLFIGFRELGGFDSISEAKRYAQGSGLTGVFNLLGDNYRDAWYVFECKTKKEETRT